MKVAILITGHLRTWELCRSELLNFLNGCEYDIYFHTYETLKGYHPYLEKVYNVTDNSRKSDDILDLVKIRLKTLVIENEDVVIDEIKEIEDKNYSGFQWQEYGPYDDLQIVRGKGISIRTYSQYRKFRECFKLCTGNYDWVLRIRPDIDWTMRNDTTLLSILNQLERNDNIVWTLPTGMQPSDVLFLSTPKALETLLDGMKEISFPTNREYNPHEFLAYSANLKNITLKCLVQIPQVGLKRM